MAISDPNLDPHYQTRITHFDQYAESRGTKGSVVLLGDSITEANPAVEIDGYAVYNMGISGDQADAPDRGLLRRIYQIAQFPSEHLFLLIGVNDILSGKHPSLLLHQYAQVLKALKMIMPSTTVHVQSILPVRDEFAHLTPLIQAINQELSSAVPPDSFIDLWPLFADTEGLLKEELTDDGVHLLPPAYEVWNAFLADVLKKP